MNGQQHAQLDDLPRALLFLRDVTVEEGEPAPQHLDGSFPCKSCGCVLVGIALTNFCFFIGPLVLLLRR
jgi:hypothetical protein